MNHVHKFPMNEKLDPDNRSLWTGIVKEQSKLLNKWVNYDEEGKLTYEQLKEISDMIAQVATKARLYVLGNLK